MRYNPDIDRAVSIDDIAAQCRNAITTPAPTTPSSPRWGEMAKGCHKRWKFWGAGNECSGSRTTAEHCQAYHAADVAAAFGDHRRAERIRNQIACLI